MIEYKTGDILAEEAEALVNSVNCAGVMGRGIALQFKKAFPGNFDAYVARCERNEMRPGHVFVFETGETVFPRYIINFPTKRHWRGKSRIEDIESGLASLTKEIRSYGIRSIAIPPLGSGLGGLHWPEVRDRLETALKECEDVKVVIFEPGGGPMDERANSSSTVPKITAVASGADRADGSLSFGPAGPVRDATGSPQAHVFHAGGWRAVTAQISKGTVWTVCRESAARSAHN